MRARKLTLAGNVTARWARQSRLFPLSARTGTTPCVSDISKVSKPAGAGTPGGPPGTRTANCALVMPGDREICSRISAYCTSGEPLRTGRTMMSIDAAESMTRGRFPRCAAAGVTTRRPHTARPSNDETRIFLRVSGRPTPEFAGNYSTHLVWASQPSHQFRIESAGRLDRGNVANTWERDPGRPRNQTGNLQPLRDGRDIV
jgi:hypothetical protein